jgi:hypothetical protein
MSGTSRGPIVLVMCSLLISGCVVMGAETGTGVDAIAADNNFVQALSACNSAVQEATLFNKSYPSSIVNVEGACAWPDKAEPIFTKLNDCFIALPQPSDSNLKAARSDLLESGIAYDKVIDLMRHFCTDEANPAEISEWARKASAAFDSAMDHIASYNRSIE